MPPTLVTVVIPCFNQGRYLADAIRSVRKQSSSAIEILVINDGSTDESEAIAVASGATVISQANAGLAMARNAGLQAAKGELIIFLDADDEVADEAIATGVEALRAAPWAACLVRQAEIIDAEGRTLPATYRPIDQADLYGEWLGHNFVWTPGAAMFRRGRLLAIGGFPPDVSAAADYAVYLALARAGEVVFQPRVAVRYRQHDSNMSRDPVLMLEATLRVLQRERAHLPARYAAVYSGALAQWRVFYGDQIIERLRREWRSGTTGIWRRRAVWALARHCPGVLATHLTRKLSRVVRGIAPAPLEGARAGRPDRVERGVAPAETPRG